MILKYGHDKINMQVILRASNRNEFGNKILWRGPYLISTHRDSIKYNICKGKEVE